MSQADADQMSNLAVVYFRGRMCPEMLSLLIVLRSCLPGTDPISGEKNRKNVGFGLPRKIGKN